ncbi:MAG: hypothetical protein ABSC18_01150 [Verrucomicrobiota bacterium]
MPLFNADRLILATPSGVSRKKLRDTENSAQKPQKPQKPQDFKTVALSNLSIRPSENKPIRIAAFQCGWVYFSNAFRRVEKKTPIKH